MLGMDNYPSTKMFGAFWVFKGRIVGAFLEVGLLIAILTRPRGIVSKTQCIES